MAALRASARHDPRLRERRGGAHHRLPLRASRLAHADTEAVELVRAGATETWFAAERAIARFDERAGRWRDVAIDRRRQLSGATLLADGRTVLVAGGLDDDGAGVEICVVSVRE